MDPLAWVGVALVVLGVVGTLVPLLPGAALSLAGVYLYWWTTGYASPGPLVLAGITVIGVVAVALDYLSGPAAARAGGASLRTTLAASLVGFVLLFAFGPLGLLGGIAGTVFLLEYRRHDDVEASLRTAGYATVGVLASAAVQFVLTVAMLVAFLLAIR